MEMKLLTYQPKESTNMADLKIPSTEYTTEFVPGTVKGAIAATGAKTSESLMVPLDKIVAPAGFNVRIHDPDYESRVEEVTDSIMENGFFRHMPLPGYSGKEGDQTFIYIVGGFTRFDAAKRAVQKGAAIEALPIVLKPAGTSMADLTLAVAMDNTGAPLKPYERGIVVKRLIGYGWSESQIAKKMTVSEQYVKDLLFLHSLSSPIQQMVIKGQISAGHAISMARKHGAEATKVLQAALKEAKDAEKTAAGSASTTNGSAAPAATARVTPRQTRGAAGKSGILSKKVIFGAIDYAIALPGDGIEFLSRWRKGEKDALAEVESTLKKAPRKAKAKKTTKAKRKAGGGRKPKATTNSAATDPVTGEPVPDAPTTGSPDPSLDIDL